MDVNDDKNMAMTMAMSTTTLATTAPATSPYYNYYYHDETHCDAKTTSTTIFANDVRDDGVMMRRETVMTMITVKMPGTCTFSSTNQENRASIAHFPSLSGSASINFISEDLLRLSTNERITGR